jgi:hypothetical protein
MVVTKRWLIVFASIVECSRCTKKRRKKRKGKKAGGWGPYIVEKIRGDSHCDLPHRDFDSSRFGSSPGGEKVRVAGMERQRSRRYRFPEEKRSTALGFPIAWILLRDLTSKCPYSKYCLLVPNTRLQIRNRPHLMLWAYFIVRLG